MKKNKQNTKNEKEKENLNCCEKNFDFLNFEEIIQKNGDKNILESAKLIFNDYKRFRLLYDKECLNNKLLVKNIHSLKKLSQELISNNNNLINSNKLHQTKIKSCYNSMKIYKELFKLYISNITSKKTRFIGKKSKISGYLSEGEEKAGNFPKNFEKPEEISKKFMIEFLKGLHASLNEVTNLGITKKFVNNYGKKQFSLKKSYSDPFLYSTLFSKPYKTKINDQSKIFHLFLLLFFLFYYFFKIKNNIDLKINIINEPNDYSNFENSHIDNSYAVFGNLLSDLKNNFSPKQNGSVKFKGLVFQDISAIAYK